MISRFSFKSLFEAQNIIYAAPLLVIASLFHIFDTIPGKHQFGQLEILAAFIITGYYMWVEIPNIYQPLHIKKNRIELIICAVIGMLSALTLFAPLMTWQYIKLYRSSNIHQYLMPISIAIITLWMGVFVYFYASYTFNKNIMDQLQPSSIEGKINE